MSERELLWGPLKVSYSEATEHFLVTGSTGSGKTLTIKGLMAGAIKRSRLEFGVRAVAYDAKSDIVPFLHAVSGSRNVVILNPLDERSFAWDIAKDIDSPVSARQVASILLAEEESSANEAFFNAATRDLVAGVMIAFMSRSATASSWTFRDVLLALMGAGSQEGMRDLQMLLAGCKQTQRLLSYFPVGDSRLSSNIVATLNAKLAPYEPIAAAWEKARAQGNVISLRGWLKSKQVLVLGNEETARESIDAVNRLIFRRLTELLLSQPEAPLSDRQSGTNATWVFLDEVREAGKLDGLSRLLTKGRSKNVCVVLGFQDIQGMRSVYGEHVADEIVGQCNTMAVLRLINPTTAQWAVDLFGRAVIDATSRSMQFGNEGASHGTQKSQEVRESLQTGDLMALPKTSKEAGLVGYFLDADRKHAPSGTDKKMKPTAMSWSDIEASGAIQASTSDPGFMVRDTSHLYLEPFEDTDRERLLLKRPAPQRQTVEKQRSVLDSLQKVDLYK